ncbi:FAD binding domain-containing protein [Podospora didyma]|uniref:FAD binding domain-containing protein n=1 Tax=Podospora didyma TaxID=330526 RepID=A0AAE0NWW1_9PEZI|nr:FAD binding domain-containing protein [Podospora didyma]
MRPAGHILTLGIAVVTAGSAPGSDNYGNLTDAGCAAACAELAKTFPQSGQTLVRNTTAFDDFTKTYWALEQQDVDPSCVFEPASADEVAFFVRLAKTTTCPFAVKSGGHGAFAGSSNIQDGITVSLARLTEISVSDDKATVAIGAGNHWVTVYQTLEKHDLAVPGGRYPTVGVGGLSLGGGISFFSTTRGWACDNIVSYEVITGEGDVVQADSASHPDLFWALRGGGNNFGIVTKITMEAFALPAGAVFGGLRVSLDSEESSAALINAAYNLGTTGAAADPLAGQIVNFGVVGGNKVGLAILSYAAPVDRPAVLSEFLAIPAVMDSAKLRTLANLSAELASGGGDNSASVKSRRSRATATFHLNTDIMKHARTVCFEEFGKVTDVSGISSFCIFQVITKQQLEVSTAKGGNALGLDAADGPLFLLNILQSWKEAADDVRVRQATRSIIERTVEYGETKGWNLGYRYMNYAGEFQDVVAGYGEENQKKLVAIAARWDPRGVMQKLQPGGFKLSGTPLGASA